MNKIALGIRFPHHMKNSGYRRLIDYLNKDYLKYEFMEDFSKNIPNSIRSFIRLSLEVMRRYPSLNSHFIDELSVLRMHSNSSIFHLYTENTCLFSFSRFNNNNKIYGTFHLPPESYKSFTPKYLESRYEKLSHIIAISPTQYHFLSKQLSNPNISLIPHGIDVNHYSYSYEPNLENPYFISIGIHGRNFSIIEKIMKQMSLSSKIKCIIVTTQKVLINAPNIEIKSNISDDELRSLYTKAQFIYLPLEFATANNSILECLSLGVPIITTDLPDTRYYIGDDNGIFIEKNAKISEYIDGFRLLHEDEKYRQILSKKGRKKSLELDWKKISAVIESIIE